MYTGCLYLSNHERILTPPTHPPNTRLPIPHLILSSLTPSVWIRTFVTVEKKAIREPPPPPPPPPQLSDVRTRPSSNSEGRHQKSARGSPANTLKTYGRSRTRTPERRLGHEVPSAQKYGHGERVSLWGHPGPIGMVPTSSRQKTSDTAPPSGRNTGTWNSTQVITGTTRGRHPFDYKTRGPPKDGERTTNRKRTIPKEVRKWELDGQTSVKCTRRHSSHIKKSGQTIQTEHRTGKRGIFQLSLRP